MVLPHRRNCFYFFHPDAYPHFFPKTRLMQHGRNRLHIYFGTKKNQKIAFFFTNFFNFTVTKELNLLYLFKPRIFMANLKSISGFRKKFVQQGD